MDELSEDCTGCKFAFPMISDDDLVIKCRRYPPQIYVVDDVVCQTFPDTHHRCGEYKSQE